MSRRGPRDVAVGGDSNSARRLRGQGRGRPAPLPGKRTSGGPRERCRAHPLAARAGPGRIVRPGWGKTRGLLCAWGANEDNKLPGAPMEGWGPGVLVPLPDKGLGSPRKSSSFSPFLLWKFPLSPLLTHRS